ncbi:hypothetical protein [Noviherbaspirillum soli]|uniref:hypothetical protein n=1 Tax=Noviherbaspirillum soli TaxID=1064518 RepID=UPI00188ADB44|nr:hypothetical protein [Noviherbaspirillum soli]
MKGMQSVATINVQTDMFGAPSEDSKRVRVKAVPLRLQKTIPVITGGLFALNDSISPERFSATFHSGGSAYFDALGLTMAGKDVGVVADLVRPRVMDLLKSYLSRGGKVFVDSGAYGRFAKWKEGKAETPLADFQKVFAVYDELVEGTPTACLHNLHLVMPDVLAHPEWSLALLQEHRSKILGYVGANVSIIIPLQKGLTPAGVTADKVAGILGTREITLGIPSAAAAMSLSDVATIRGFRRFHILGRASMGLPLFKIAYAFLENCPGAQVSCDANQLRSNTPSISHEHARLIEAHSDQAWDGSFDQTEMISEVVCGQGWMSERYVKAIAGFYGVTDAKRLKEWVRQHRTGDEGLKELIEEVDPEWGLLWTCGLNQVFGEAALKALSARMRAVAVATVFEDSAVEADELALAA